SRIPATYPASAPARLPVTPGKLRPPRRAADLVARAALADRVCAPDAPALTLVRAPSGFGKTTFMAEMRDRLVAAGTPCAWLTLDAADNDALRLAVGLDAALDEIGLAPEPGADPVALPAASRGFALLDRVARASRGFALFLDDFEAIREDAALSLVKELIQALPPGARLVVGARTPPALGLARLRARGALQEVDAADLRFSEADAHAFLARRCKLPLTHPELMGLHRKTEGWPAALRLAAVALERRAQAGDFVARFAGSEGAVADYLAEDVLAGQPPERLDFLLRTSILRQLHPDLCDALHPPGGSAELLETLASGNMLLSPVEGAERCYRYHSLFADFLRAQLDRRMPGAAPALHAAAARWYAGAGRPAPAIDHFTEAGDMEGAAALPARHGRAYLEQGRVRLLARWFEALPDAALDARPDLLLVRLWAACFTRPAREALDRLEASGLERAADPAIRAEATAIRPRLLSMIDDYPAAYETGRLALADQTLRSRYAAGVLANCMTTVFTVVGAVEEARASLIDARLATTGAGAEAAGANAFNVMYVESTEGVIDFQEGRFRDAAARFRLALAASREAGAGRADGNAYAALMHAGAVYEANDLRQAAHLLHLHLPMARDVGLVDHLILGHVMLSRIAFEDGELDEAFDLLGELEHLGHRRALPRAAASARLERARALMRRGQPEAAREQIDLARDPGLWQRARGLRFRANDLLFPEMSALRLDLAEGRGAEALPGLRAEIAAARAERRLRRACALRLLEGTALHQAGDRAAATRVLCGVLGEAAREGLMR
ncbi:MAG: helix-turn-helix transcriptional regulator, partial [Pseudomonadota bacterium]|nr:helix-turn-helix transcriptional regulator [Pseudomonadota bacterium]